MAALVQGCYASTSLPPAYLNRLVMLLQGSYAESITQYCMLHASIVVRGRLHHYAVLGVGTRYELLLHNLVQRLRQGTMVLVYIYQSLLMNQMLVFTILPSHWQYQRVGKLSRTNTPIYSVCTYKSLLSSPMLVF